VRRRDKLGDRDEDDAAPEQQHVRAGLIAAAHYLDMKGMGRVADAGRSGRIYALRVLAERLLHLAARQATPAY